MQTFTFTDPDGEEHSIDGPDGATREQAFEKLKMRLNSEMAEAQQQSQLNANESAAPATPADMPQWAQQMAGDMMPQSAADRREELYKNLPARAVTQPLAEGAAGMGRRLMEIGSLGNYEGNPDTNEILDESLAATVGGVLGDVNAGGLLAAAAPLAGPAAGVMRALGAPKSLFQALAGGAAYGAATSKDRAEGALGGGIGGAVGQQVPKLLARAAKPAVTDSARKLIAKGVDNLTPGDLLGGVAKRTEDSLTSLPYVGEFIAGAKSRSLESFNKSVLNEAAEKVGGRVTAAGAAGLKQADDIISNAYDDILTGSDIKLSSSLMDRIKIPTKLKNVSKAGKQQYKRILSNLNEVIEQGDLTGDQFKKADSFLRREAKKLLKNQDPMYQEVGQRLKSLHRALIREFENAYPEKGVALKAADQGYAQLMNAYEASSKAAANDLFTPAQYIKAIQKGSSAKGKMKQSDWLDYARAAQETLPSKVADSGTAGRGMLGLLAGGIIDPTIMGAGAVGAGAYSKPGIGILNKTILNRPGGAEALRRILEETVQPIGSQAGRGLLLN